MLGGKLAIGMGIAMVVMAGLFGLYFKMSQAKIATLNQEVAVQTVRAASAEANLEFMQESVRKQQAAIKKLAGASAEIRKEQDVTIDLFAEHDLKALAERKPGLIEIRINRATAKVFDELEKITDPLSFEPLAEFLKEEEE